MFYNEKIFKRCFCYNKRSWYKNIKRIPLYFKLMKHLIKHGYDEYANWETFDWFINIMKPILTSYIQNGSGYPCEFENEEEWYKILSRMIELLDLMDENHYRYAEYDYDYRRIDREMNEAKDEFFQLFAKYFYNLWD